MQTNNPPKRKFPQSKRTGSSSYGGGTSFSEPAGQEAASADMLRNVPPHSIEAEQAVLGGVFLKPDSLYTILDMLAEEDFYLPAHRAIFSAFRTLYQKSAPVDLVAVAEQLKADSLLEEAAKVALCKITAPSEE